MTINPTLTTLAERFNASYALKKPEPETWIVWHEDRGSPNGRISWTNVQASRSERREGRRTITMDGLYRRVGGRLQWDHLFTGLHHGLIVGPKTLAAVEECFEILRNDVPPEDDGTKVRHVNHLGGVNWVSKPTFHEWELSDRLGKVLSQAFFADRREKTLYSDDFVYTLDSHSGWSRCT